RRDAIEFFKNQKKKSVITEDDMKDAEKEMQKITDNHITQIDKVVADKDKELMEI
ncbi:MAG: ribosome recycling factor, partial [Clostridia bacterium]|nr:ribosome recycling factor [Clostridia bacterium]